MKNSSFLFLGILILFGCPANTSLPEAKKDETVPVSVLNQGSNSQEPVKQSASDIGVPLTPSVKDQSSNANLQKAGIIAGGAVTLGMLYLIHKSLREKGNKEVKAMFDKYDMEMPRTPEPGDPKKQAEEVKRVKQIFQDLEATNTKLVQTTEELRKSDKDLDIAVKSVTKDASTVPSFNDKIKKAEQYFAKTPIASTIKLALKDRVDSDIILQNLEGKYTINLEYFKSFKPDQSKYNQAVDIINQVIQNIHKFVDQALAHAKEVEKTDKITGEKLFKDAQNAKSSIRDLIQLRKI